MADETNINSSALLSVLKTTDAQKLSPLDYLNIISIFNTFNESMDASAVGDALSIVNFVMGIPTNVIATSQSIPSGDAGVVRAQFVLVGPVSNSPLSNVEQTNFISAVFAIDSTVMNSLQVTSTVLNSTSIIINLEVCCLLLYSSSCPLASLFFFVSPSSSFSYL